MLGIIFIKFKICKKFINEIKILIEDLFSNWKKLKLQYFCKFYY